LAQFSSPYRFSLLPPIILTHPDTHLEQSGQSVLNCAALDTSEIKTFILVLQKEVTSTSRAAFGQNLTEHNTPFVTGHLSYCETSQMLVRS